MPTIDGDISMMETEELEQIEASQGITSNFFDKDTYRDLMNTDSDEEPVVKHNVALCTQDSVSLEKKGDG